MHWALKCESSDVLTHTHFLSCPTRSGIQRSYTKTGFPIKLGMTEVIEKSECGSVLTCRLLWYYGDMTIVVGIDEVGRGCWAGPLVAAAVLWTKPIAGLKDSKLLTRKQRKVLAETIKANAVYGLGWVEPAQV